MRSSVTRRNKVALGLRSRRQLRRLESSQYEVIDRLAGPSHMLVGGNRRMFGNRRMLRCGKGPMALERGALFDPAAEHFDLFSVEPALLGGRRHVHVRFERSDPPIQFARIRLVRDDHVHGTVFFTRGECEIQSQMRLASPSICAVTVEAFVGQYRTHVAVEPNSLCSANGTRNGKQCNGHHQRGGTAITVPVRTTFLASGWCEHNGIRKAVCHRNIIDGTLRMPNSAHGVCRLQEGGHRNAQQPTHQSA